ncbi:hypothetical protein HK101_007835 [Irineochytrium annulatum]|nr:hypothetical protein HK101_007835 [Irineochytrium annulatum]
MFGVIVGGRPVQMSQQVAESKYLFEVIDAKSVNHIVVFLTGQALFPPGFAATVHFLWPNPNAPATWQMLGYLSNEKPSAIFKLSNNGGGSASKSQMMLASDEMMEDNVAGEPVTAQLGISIEPEAVVYAAVSAMSSEAKTSTSSMVGSESALVVPAKAKDVGLKLLESLYNYCASFATSLPQGATPLFGMNWDSTYFPLKALQTWYEKEKRKLEMQSNSANVLL